MDQNTAQEYCASLGLELLSNENPTFYAWIKEKLQAKSGSSRQMFWLGAQRTDITSNWFWNLE